MSDINEFCVPSRTFWEIFEATFKYKFREWFVGGWCAMSGVALFKLCQKH